MIERDVLLRGRLIVFVTVIASLGLLIDLWAWRAPDDELASVAWPLLSLSAEANVPTWVASMLLACCALSAGAIAARHEVGARGRWHWWGIAGALGWVSLDEVAGFHEHLGGHLELGGVLYFDWVIWAALIVGVLAVIYLPFLRRLRSPTRERLVIAAVVFVSGALVMELPLGWWTEREGINSLGYAVIDWVEETLELVGTCLALVGLEGERRA